MSRKSVTIEQCICDVCEQEFDQNFYNTSIPVRDVYDEFTLHLIVSVKIKMSETLLGSDMPEKKVDMCPSCTLEALKSAEATVRQLI